MKRGLNANLFAALLRSIPSHRLRKQFAKITGPWFAGSVARTKYGFLMVCDWYDNTNRMAFEGSHFLVEDFIERVPAGALYIDIGANHGATALLAARQLNDSGGKVLAFEPNHRLFEVLRTNIQLNHYCNVEVFPQAVGPNWEKHFLDDRDIENSGAAHISDQGEEITVRPLTLDFIEQIGPRAAPIFCKIDTEGYEMNVLRGISELLVSKRIQALAIEIDSSHLARFGNSPPEIYEHLGNLGFRPVFGLRAGHYDELFILEN